MSKVSHIPKGYQAVTPYLIIKGAAQAIDYYKKVFGATELFRMDGPDGKVGHAELQIGDSHIMLADLDRQIGTHLLDIRPEAQITRNRPSPERHQDDNRLKEVTEIDFRAEPRP